MALTSTVTPAVPRTKALLDPKDDRETAETSPTKVVTVDLSAKVLHLPVTPGGAAKWTFISAPTSPLYERLKYPIHLSFGAKGNLRSLSTVLVMVDAFDSSLSFKARQMPHGPLPSTILTAGGVSVISFTAMKLFFEVGNQKGQPASYKATDSNGDLRENF